MLKKVMGALFFIFAIITLSACGDKTDDPGQAAVAFVEAIAAGNSDKVISLIYLSEMQGDPNAEQFKRKFKMIVEETGKQVKKQGGLSKVEIISVEYSEDKNSAIVTLKTKLKDGVEKTQAQEMINVDGKWKVNFK
ncbi:DUF4878 domain-containing protein [Proteus sp. G2669]|uniref:DUF4878 domain-containing protein n=1 Tax=unclassified Proteus (in: enterobacteria) TaxID=257482 RepID=UPI0014132C0D|nr:MULTISPECIES: DUF4878 domain-containing protein [unclassified Proteus (in: enterobacteria)]NBM55610.1 DUF4878 domain-containing protein [Proteus sp. G2669]UDN34395.1 DUF4878 domain-containing protein [Proteus sp. NMG38-2]